MALAAALPPAARRGARSAGQGDRFQLRTIQDANLMALDLDPESAQKA